MSFSGSRLHAAGKRQQGGALAAMGVWPGKRFGHAMGAVAALLGMVSRAVLRGKSGANAMVAPFILATLTRARW